MGPIIIFLFLISIIVVILSIIINIFNRKKPVNNREEQIGIQSRSETENNTDSNDYYEECYELDIPIEILPNQYSLSIDNVNIVQKIGKHSWGSDFNYITLKFRINYSLNDKKEGKRRLIVTSYDKNDNIVDIQGDIYSYYFNNAGVEICEYCFNNTKTVPSKFSVSVREGTKDTVF